MKKINKKGMESWVLVTIIVSIFFLVIASFTIIPKLSSLGGWIQEKIGFNFGISEDTTTQPIDEERIDTDTSVDVMKVAFDAQSEDTHIIKQAYNQGWNLESIFLEPPIKNKAGEIIKAQTSHQTIIIPNKKLSEVLASDFVRGSISVNGKTYVHIPSQNNGCLFVSRNEQETYGGEQYNDNNNNCQRDTEEPYTDANKNGKYDAEEPITPDALAQLIVADLFNQAGGAK
ncbi:hypothetical protein HZA99_05515 [Candidatus Woesearchaeota archaeon]|nr:hypothetical protein [Candidatus Woesearchaeota archaeon]